MVSLVGNLEEMINNVREQSKKTFTKLNIKKCTILIIKKIYK